jgi:putative sterol carrier protein
MDTSSTTQPTGQAPIGSVIPDLDAVIACRSEDDFWKIASGELDSIVAGLRGRLAIRGNDLALAVKVLRGLETKAHQLARKET